MLFFVRGKLKRKVKIKITHFGPGDERCTPRIQMMQHLPQDMKSMAIISQSAKSLRGGAGGI